MHALSKATLFVVLILLAACGSPQPKIPALTPEQAAQLLDYNNKAKAWIIYVKRQNPACSYKLDLPDQSANPTEIDLQHIVYCGAAPAPMQFDASASFAYDKTAQRWTVSRFSS